MECGRLLHVIETAYLYDEDLVVPRGVDTPAPRPTIMSSWSVGVNPYASVAAVLRGEEPGRLGTSYGEGGDLPSWLGWELESSRESRLVWR